MAVELKCHIVKGKLPLTNLDEKILKTLNNEVPVVPVNPKCK